LRFFARQGNKQLAGFTDETRAAMLAHHWPGNVRELRNAVERAAILAAGPLVGTADLPAQIVMPRRTGVELGSGITLEELEAEHIRRILESGWPVEESARVLGIDASTLYRKRKRYGL
jgi:NtrC-family two-component system response regulator AlgB